jgi:hypothetical protein
MFQVAIEIMAQALGFRSPIYQMAS